MVTGIQHALLSADPPVLLPRLAQLIDFSPCAAIQDEVRLDRRAVRNCKATPFGERFPTSTHSHQPKLL